MGSVLLDESFVDEDTGLACRVINRRLPGFGSYWLGYVTLPRGHLWHGLDYDDIPVDAHGGLTYAGADGDGWRIGFDAAHAEDGWQDEQWARNECRALAAQCNVGEGRLDP